MLLEPQRAGAMEGGLPDRSYGCRGMQPLPELQEIPGPPLSSYPQISCQSQLGARGQERLGDAVHRGHVSRVQRIADNRS